MKGPDLVEKMKKQLIKNGYPDVDVKIIGDVPQCEHQLHA